jgi:carboxyl-terminal processing protease
MLAKRKKYLLIIPAIIILAVLIFGGGFYLGNSERVIPTPSDTIIINRELGQPEAIDFSLFWQVLKKIEEEYVDSKKIDYQKILYGAISGMTESLDDPYTVFMEPQKTKDFVESVESGGSFEGVGMELGIKGEILTVVAPLEGTPAARAGIKAGDKILKIDDTPTDNLLVEEAVSLIRGKRGTKVVLTISRKGFKEPKEITLIRETIQVPIVKWELKNDNIAYIKIYQFTGNLPDKFQDIASAIIKSKSQKIILDLRNNPGGYLEVAADIASWFLPRGEVVAIEDFGKEETQKKYRSDGYKGFQDFSVVVLINKGSASASEIVAGALRDIKNIKLVGETSFGKGSVQSLERFKDGASLKITIAKWLTPSGISISDEGLKPDIEIELTDEDYDADRDPQLDKAIELLKM